MTTTEASLPQARDIVDEYLRHDFTGIFMRPLSPYGFALKTKFYRAYIFRGLIHKMEADPFVRRLFTRWANTC